MQTYVVEDIKEGTLHHGPASSAQSGPMGNGGWSQPNQQSNSGGWSEGGGQSSSSGSFGGGWSQGPSQSQNSGWDDQSSKGNSGGWDDQSSKGSSGGWAQQSSRGSQNYGHSSKGQGPVSGQGKVSRIKMSSSHIFNNRMRIY